MKKKYGKCYSCLKGFWYVPETVTVLLNPLPSGKKERRPICTDCTEFIAAENERRNQA